MKKKKNLGKIGKLKIPEKLKIKEKNQKKILKIN